jgi:hypothetical protein
MGQQPIVNHVRADLVSLLEETFGTHHGHFLDRGTSLAETLATISAGEASRPVGQGCACVAAQVNHVTFALEVVERKMRGEEVGPVDWPASWDVASVDDTEWQALRRRLHTACERLLATVNDTTVGNDADKFRRAFEILAHTAYHLGEIRQALCTLKSEGQGA